MTTTAIHLPQTDASGLSENWLFKHCGEQHWNCLCEAMGVGGVESSEMRDDHGSKLYPTFVTIRARYSRPLASVDMDERFRTSVELAHFGRAFFNSTIRFERGEAVFVLEMLTAFAARKRQGHNELHRSEPLSHLAYGSRRLTQPPPLLRLSQAWRHGEVGEHELLGYRFRPEEQSLDEVMLYEPSPYTDYNGAGLLYFAAYPTIADTLERRILTDRRLLNGHGPANGQRDWALSASTVGRDVFYYRNLDLGQKLVAHLRRFEQRGDEILIHTRLEAEHDSAVLADVVTVKRWLD